LPRLFVYHVAATDTPGIARFIVMERRLFFLMSLGALMAVLCGIAMLIAAPGYLEMSWLRIKLLLVAGLVGYHAWCYRLVLALRAGRGAHSQRWYRLFNELPALFLVLIVVLAVVKPW
jgi:putative membrane protein